MTKMDMINEVVFSRAAFEVEVTTDTPVKVPASVRGLNITLQGTGSVEYTNSPVAVVERNEAVWIQWPKGNVSSVGVGYLMPCTAIRIAPGSSATMSVRAQ